MTNPTDLPRGGLTPCEKPRRPSSSAPVWMHSRDQVASAAIVVAALSATVVFWLSSGGMAGKLVNIDEVQRGTLKFQLDVNEAHWPELTLLPGIGETLAKRIVESRQRDGDFQHAEDLLRVSGIGPKKLADLSPYLLPIERGPAPSK